MQFKANFFTSVAELKDLPLNTKSEIAFVGRSNSGKSSALNTITGIKSLAKTSKTPGRTQLINFFSIGNNQYFVDLPGYGYAKINATIKKRWQQTLAQYLAYRESLIGVILIMDIRHPFKPQDIQMIEWCLHYQRKVHILLTKADKLSRNAVNSALEFTKKQLQTYKEFQGHISIQKFSSTNSEGIEEVHSKIDEWLI